MWGTLKPHSCRLPDGSKSDYQHLYCGLCKGLGDGFGQASRALVSHDAVFVGLLVEALSEAASERSKCRCPMLPVVHRPILEPGSVPIRFAASVQILLGDQWLADRALEGKRVAKLLRSLASGHVERANTMLEGLGVDFEPVRHFDRVQADAERLGVTDVASASRPTEHALGFVFGTISRLPGSSAEATRARVVLERLGSAVGRLIYLTDALDDLEKDYLGRDYNPLLSIERGLVVIDARRVEQAAALVKGAVESLGHDVALLPLVRHRALVEDVLLTQLPKLARAALAKARRAAATQRRAQLMRLRAASTVRRAVHAVGVLAAFLFAWLLGQRSAFAQRNPKPKSTALPTASVSASASASASAASSNLPPMEIPAIKPRRDGEQDDAEGGASASGSGTGGGGPGGLGPNPCSGCGSCDCCKNACDSCTAACKSCGSCGNCCDGCKICEGCGSCGNCCDGCKGCDGCCNGPGCNGCCR